MQDDVNLGFFLASATQEPESPLNPEQEATTVSEWWL